MLFNIFGLWMSLMVAATLTASSLKSGNWHIVFGANDDKVENITKTEQIACEHMNNITGLSFGSSHANHFLMLSFLNNSQRFPFIENRKLLISLNGTLKTIERGIKDLLKTDLSAKRFCQRSKTLNANCRRDIYERARHLNLNYLNELNTFRRQLRDKLRNTKDDGEANCLLCISAFLKKSWFISQDLIFSLMIKPYKGQEGNTTATTETTNTTSTASATASTSTSTSTSTSPTTSKSTTTTSTSTSTIHSAPETTKSPNTPTTTLTTTTSTTTTTETPSNETNDPASMASKPSTETNDSTV